MDIDPVILDWIYEFLLQRTLDLRLLRRLVKKLPFSDDSRVLKKLLLLKQLQSDILHSCSISETTLEYLETIKQLELDGGVEEVSDAMKRAYCLVAVECSMKCLNVEDGDFSKFRSSVKRVWMDRVRVMKNVEKGGLGSDELWSWNEYMEAAVQDDRVIDRVVKKSKGVNALEVLRVYLEEERTKPSILELLARSVKDDEIRNIVFGLGNAIESVHKESILHGADRGSVVNNDNREMQSGFPSRSKSVALRHARVGRSGTSRGSKIADPDCLIVKNLTRKLPHTPEVNRVQDALKSSSLELKYVVKDPLPDALRLAERVSGMERGSTEQEPIQESRGKPYPSAVESDRVVQAKGGHPNNGPRQNLMERNNTARTQQAWDESIDDLSEESLDHGSRLKLPSSKRKLASPLDKYEAEKPKLRRHPKKWSNLEEQTLREGVKKCGEGNWQVIKKTFPEIFKDRTKVDLKDKWRNLTRY